MAKIERVDTKGSFTTLLILTSDNGKETHEIHVPVWEADAMETKIKTATWLSIKTLRDKEGRKTVKGV